NGRRAAAFQSEGDAAGAGASWISIRSSRLGGRAARPPRLSRRPGHKRTAVPGAAGPTQRSIAAAFWRVTRSKFTYTRKLMTGGMNPPSGGKEMPYPEMMIKPMRDDLTRIG